jgi:hypothetical protein
MSCEQNAGQNYGFKIANKSFETVAEFIYFGMKLTSQSCMHEKKKKRNEQSEYQPELVQNFFLPVCYPEIQILKYTELNFFLLLCKGVKLDFSHLGENVG